MAPRLSQPARLLNTSGDIQDVSLPCSNQSNNCLAIQESNVGIMGKKFTRVLAYFGIAIDLSAEHYITSMIRQNRMLLMLDIVHFVLLIIQVAML